MEIIKNKKKRKNIILYSMVIMFMLLSVFGISKNVSHSAVTYKTYTKSQLQDIIVSTAFSYLNNKWYSEYDQKTMEEGALGDSGTSTSMNWRNFNVSPEEANRTNYYHVDCSTFASLVYIHSLGYDYSDYYKLSPSYYYKFNDSTSKFAYYKVSEYRSNLRFTNGYKYYGKSISTTFFENLGEAKTDVAGEEYKNTSVSNTDIVVYHYNFKGGEDQTAFKKKIEALLQPGDIVNYRRNVSGSVKGHAMVYVGDLFESSGGFIHSTGSDFLVEGTILKQIGDDSNSVRYDGMYRLYNNIFSTTTPGVSVTVLRPINSYYDSSTKKYKVDSSKINSNIAARVDLMGLRTEQYVRSYNATLEDVLSKNVKENLWASSKYNSVNIGEELTYNLYAPNYTKIGFCSGNGYYNSSSTCSKNSTSTKPLTWKTATISNSFKGMTITAKIPSNSEYVKDSCNYSCTVSNGVVTWKNVTIASGKEPVYRFRVKVTGGEQVIFEGYKIKTSKGNYLQMEEDITNVNPTIAKLNAEAFRKEINKFKKLVDSGTIKYTTGDSSYKLDLDNPKSANISGYGFFKNIYYNAMGIDLGYLSGSNIREAIFNHDANYNYSKKTDEQIKVITNTNQKIINEMLVKGFYGGRHLHGNDSRDRTGRLRITDLEFGDIIVYYVKADGKNAGTSASLMYVGTDVNDESTSTENQLNSYFLRFTNDNKVTLYTMNSSKTAYQLFNELYTKDLFVVLRPTQYYGTTVNYSGATIFGENLSVEYNTYKNLKTPTSSAKYTVTLDYNNSNFSCSNCKLTYTGGKTFNNWYSDSSYSKVVKNGDKLASSNAHTLYVKWNYSSMTLPSGATAGYKIEGWYTNKTLTSKAGVPNSKYTINKTRTLYAKWEANKYTIKYNANGGSGTMSNSTHTYDKDSSLSINTYYKDGYVFAGWSTTKGGSIVYLDGANVRNLTTGTDTVTLYAVWRKKHSNEVVVTLNVTNGYADAKKKVVVKGNNVSFTILPNKGYGNVNVKCDNGVLNGNSLTISNVTKDITCNVVYEANKYKIQYNPTGGNGSMEGSSHTYGISSELNENKFTKVGYKFIGWSKTVSNKVEYIDSENVLNVTDKSETIILYAVWKPINYEIIYKLDGGTLKGKISTYNTLNTIKLPKPTKKGYKFIGWTGSNGRVPQVDVTILQGSTGNKIYTANYEEGTYKVTYLSDNYGAITGKREEILKYMESPTGTTYVTNGNYKVLKWSVNKDVKLKDGTIILKNAPITIEQIKNIVIEEDIVITLYHYDIKYLITYNNGDNGSVAGISSEEVNRNSNPLGTYVLSNTGYVFKYWRADKNVVLSTGETIIVGSPIYNVTGIIVNDNISLTPVFDVGTYSISYVADENIRISGNTSEMVTYPNKIFGTTYEVIDSNYKFNNWTSNVNVLLDSNETIEAGNAISDEQLKHVIGSNNMIIKANSKRSTYYVYYKSLDGIYITSSPKEMLDEGTVISGVEFITKDNIDRVVYVSDKDVTLNDGTIIKAGNSIKVVQLKQVVVSDDLTLTLKYEEETSEIELNGNYFIICIAILVGVLLGGFIITRLGRKTRY